jgi:Uma2 family endonuclease
MRAMDGRRIKRCYTFGKVIAMIQRDPVTHFTPDEYLAIEEVSKTKHEYVNGKIYARESGTADHALIQVTITMAVFPYLRGTSCRIFSSDLRVGVEKADMYTYPDLSVVCSGLRYDARSNTTITNPTVLVEVLSPTTQAYDRGDKFKFYKQIPSLQEYVIVEAERPHVEVLQRFGQRWDIEMYDGLDAVVILNSLKIEIPLRQIYEKVSWLST